LARARRGRIAPQEQVHAPGDFEELRLGSVLRGGPELRDPGNERAPAPIVRGAHEPFAGGVAQAITREVVERSGDVLDDDAAARAQELRPNPRMIAERGPPGARERRAHAAVEVEQSDGEILERRGVRSEPLPFAETASYGALDARRPEDPERCVDQVNAEVHQ